jgi:hypothetical protein
MLEKDEKIWFGRLFLPISELFVENKLAYEAYLECLRGFASFKNSSIPPFSMTCIDDINGIFPTFSTCCSFSTP